MVKREKVVKINSGWIETVQLRDVGKADRSTR